MAKGITNQPLVIWVWHGWYAVPPILDLMRAGHAVVNIGMTFRDWPQEPDLIIHPAAGWTEDLFDYIPAALTRARARRKK